MTPEYGIFYNLRQKLSEARQIADSAHQEEAFLIDKETSWYDELKLAQDDAIAVLMRIKNITSEIQILVGKRKEGLLADETAIGQLADAQQMIELGSLEIILGSSAEKMTPILEVFMSQPDVVRKAAAGLDPATLRRLIVEFVKVENEGMDEN